MKNRIKIVRKSQKLTQQKFADALNISKSTVEGYEYGRLNVTDRTIADVCRLYNINEIWLRTGEGEMCSPLEREEEIALMMANMEKSELYYKFHKLISEASEEELKMIDEWAHRIADEQKQKPLV